MEIITFFIRAVYKIISFRYSFGVLLMLFVFQVYTYAQSTDAVELKSSPLDTIPEEARALFESYAPKTDTAQVAFVQKYKRDKFIKRVSFHTNAVDWVTLVPNIGIEVDLSQSPRNNYSIAMFGKFNGNSRHGKLVYNVNAFRVEGRKYWRTGKFGTDNRYYDDMVKIVTDTASAYFNADTLAGVRYYNDGLGEEAKKLGITGIASLRGDSLDFADDSLGIKKGRFRSWLYNTYHKVRRNVTSGRTLDNPRNWRAYYVGLWAGVDNWSISLTGNGNQGKGVGAGVVAGYTLPLWPQKYPREGSLDLDLGVVVGWKAVKYDAYAYEEQTQHYVHDVAASQPSWKIVPYPIIQDIHVSLVWRFRGIKHKVDRSLIDDFYNRKVVAYKDRKSNANTHATNVIEQRKKILEAIKLRTGVKADSASFWDTFHRRRLEAARRIKPDTVFSDRDQQEFLRLIKGIPVEKQKKYLKEQKKLQDKVAKEYADSLKDVTKETERKAKKEAKEAEKAAKAKAKESEDSVVSLRDSMSVPIPVITPDSVPLTLPVESVPKEEEPEEDRHDGRAQDEEEEEDGEEKQDDAVMLATAGRKRVPYIYINKV